MVCCYQIRCFQQVLYVIGVHLLTIFFKKNHIKICINLFYFKRLIQVNVILEIFKIIEFNVVILLITFCTFNFDYIWVHHSMQTPLVDYKDSCVMI